MSRRRGNVVCPKCHAEFDISYARVFACGSCPSSVQCSQVKCPECGHEFPRSSPF